MIKKYNISKPEKYIKDGVEKTYWANVGTMTEFKKQDGTVSRILEIPAISLKANIFEIKQKENQEIKTQTIKVEEKEDKRLENYQNEEIDPNDIPF